MTCSCHITLYPHPRRSPAGRHRSPAHTVNSQSADSRGRACTVASFTEDASRKTGVGGRESACADTTCTGPWRSRGGGSACANSAGTGLGRPSKGGPRGACCRSAAWLEGGLLSAGGLGGTACAIIDTARSGPHFGGGEGALRYSRPPWLHRNEGNKYDDGKDSCACHCLLPPSI